MAQNSPFLTFPWLVFREVLTRVPPNFCLHRAFLAAGEVSHFVQSHTCLQLFPAVCFRELKWPEIPADV